MNLVFHVEVTLRAKKQIRVLVRHDMNERIIYGQYQKAGWLVGGIVQHYVSKAASQGKEITKKQVDALAGLLMGTSETGE
jgi:hypothetical protein